MDKYINPFTDFGFKKLFGEEANKALLLSFLNELLIEKSQIIDLQYLKNEQLGTGMMDRRAVFDLYCQNERGEKFIVELQKAKQQYFKDRSLFYSTFAIQEQAQKGNDWDYELKDVYTISIMDFKFDNLPQFRHNIQLLDRDTHKVFYDKLLFIYLEMPKFHKTLEELENNYDKWLYLLKNISLLDRMPEKFKESIFEDMFKIAEIANYDAKEEQAYRESLKYYRDWNSVVKTAIGEREIEIVSKAIQKGADNTFIADITGLKIEQIEEIRKNTGN